MSDASNLPAKIVTGFVDSQINDLLSLDTKREVAFSLVPIGHQQIALSPAPQISPLDLPIVPYSKEEIDYPAMRKMHEASSLDSASEVAAVRGPTPPHAVPPVKGTTTPLQLPDDSVPPTRSRK